MATPTPRADALNAMMARLRVLRNDPEFIALMNSDLKGREREIQLKRLFDKYRPVRDGEW